MLLITFFWDRELRSDIIAVACVLHAVPKMLLETSWTWLFFFLHYAPSHVKHDLWNGVTDSVKPWGSWGVPRLVRASGVRNQCCPLLCCRILVQQSIAGGENSACLKAYPAGVAPKGSRLLAMGWKAHQKLETACAAEFAQNILAVKLFEHFIDRPGFPCWYEAPDEPVTAFMFCLLNTWKTLRKQIRLTQNKHVVQSSKIMLQVSYCFLLSSLLISFFSWPGCCLYFSVFKAFKVPWRPWG